MHKADSLIADSSFHDLMELPWKRSFILMMRAKSIRNIFDEFKHEFSPFLQQNYHKIEGLTLLDPFRLDNNLSLLEKAINVDGDIVECGCFKGGNALLMALWLKSKNISKKIILFDSFEGLPEPDTTHDSGYKAGQFSASFDELNKKIIELELQDYFELHKGWFKDTVPPFLKNNPEMKFSLLHIDCDLYESTIDCFPDLFKHLNKNGIAIFDDFNDGGKGEKIAVLHTLKQDYTLCMGPAPQAYIVNDKVTSGDKNDAQFSYSFSEILNNKPYLIWLQNICKLNYAEILQNVLIQKHD